MGNFFSTIERPHLQEQVLHLNPFNRKLQSVFMSLFKVRPRTIELDGQRKEILIPPGARSGTKIRVSDAVATAPGRPKSDLYLVIKVAEDPRYQRKKE